MDKQFSTNEIQTLTASEAVRMRPHLYFDKCFREKTLDSLPFEVLCHAFDEYFDGICKTIELSINNESFTVKYDAGISLEIKDEDLTKAELIMTSIFACRNEKKHLSVSEEFCSLGMATINFAAERCELTTVCRGKMGFYIFENGKTVSRVIEIVEPENEFTLIFIKPDKSLFDNLKFTFDGINEKVMQLQSSFKDLNFIIHNNIN